MEEIDRDEIYHPDDDDELTISREQISLGGSDAFDVRAFMDDVQQTVIRQIVRRRDR